MAEHQDQGSPEFFWANGFARLEDVFDPDVLRSADAEFDQLAMLGNVQGLTIVDKGTTSGKPLGERLVRIENPQVASEVYRRLIANRELGRRVANIFSADMVQVFFAHVTSLPPIGDATIKIGWHQEEQYPDFIEGRFPTVWVPLCDITPENGPLRYIPKSHDHGVFPDRGITSPLSHEDQKAAMVEALGLTDWEEMPMTGRRGLCSIHHSRLIHGTRPNTSGHARRALVMHLRTNHNRLGRSANSLYDRYSSDFIRDKIMAPIIWGNEDENSY